MSSSLNQVELIGNFGKEPELRFTKSGVAYCHVSLATQDDWTDQNGTKHEHTEWHNVVFWNKQAENVAKYCGKGSKVFVQGKLKTRTWERNGQKHYATEIQAHEVKFLSPSKQQREESPPKDSRQRTGKPVSVPDQMGDQQIPEDIPF
jgi:single-strand DNA-binding protein